MPSASVFFVGSVLSTMDTKVFKQIQEIRSRYHYHEKKENESDK